MPARPITDLNGLVLAGGQSRRMGSDKSQIERAGKAWVRLAAQTLGSAGLDVFISIHPSQLGPAQWVGSNQEPNPNPGHKGPSTALASFAPAQLIVDQDPVSGRGPLTGILSAHLTRPESHWLVLAVDLPDVRAAIVERLVTNFAARTPLEQVVCYQGAKGFEPLCTIYSAPFLAQVMAEEGRAKRNSLQSILRRAQQAGQVKLLEPNHQERQALRNYNHPDDLQTRDRRNDDPA